MKMIAGDERTRQLLSIWAPGGLVNLSSFYGRYQGSEMQGSVVGLLRLILYDVLETIPALANVAFEGRHPGYARTTPDFELLRKALMRILQQDSINVKICILIDGLDEFQGIYTCTDTNVLCSLISELAGLARAKLIVSSRPLIAFEDAFKDHESLAVHHLTYDDIKIVVQEKLGSHPGLLALLIKAHRPLSDVVDDIVHESDGVFLWVPLVIDAMLQCLQNDDGLDQLLVTLSEVPTELEHTITYLLGKIPPRYRAEAARLFQIAHSWHHEVHPWSVSAYVMWYAIESGQRRGTSQSKPKPQVAEEEYERGLRLQKLQRKLKSRCLGLLELQSGSMCQIVDDNEDDVNHGEAYNMPNIEFLHKAVFDRLGSSNGRHTLDWNSGDGFNVDLAILQGSSRCLQMDDVPFANNFYFECAMVYNRKAEASTSHAQVTVFQAIVATMIRINTGNEKRFQKEHKRKKSESIVTQKSTLKERDDVEGSECSYTHRQVFRSHVNERNFCVVDGENIKDSTGIKSHGSKTQRNQYYYRWRSIMGPSYTSNTIWPHATLGRCRDASDR